MFNKVLNLSFKLNTIASKLVAFAASILAVNGIVSSNSVTVVGEVLLFTTRSGLDVETIISRGMVPPFIFNLYLILHPLDLHTFGNPRA